MIDIFLGNNYSRYVGDLTPYAIEKLRSTLAFVKQGCEHTERFQKGEWDGLVHLFTPGDQFYTGLLANFISVLQECKLEYRIFDRRQAASSNFPELKFTRPSYIQERDYEEYTVTKCVEKTRGIMSVGTGGGKTLMATEIIGRIKVKPFMFYVLTKDLLYQAKETIASCLNCEIGQIGDGVCDIKDINVCTKDAVIYALNHGKKTFDIRDYKFDSCDAWDDSEIFGDSDCERIKDVVSNCRGIYFDECLSGDSKIETEDGVITICDAIERKSMCVKTYDGNNVMYKSILNWWKKGKRETIVIEFDGGEIKCTKNHPILTKNGWKKAENLLLEDEVLYADMITERNLHWINMEEKENWCKVLKISEGMEEEVFDIEVQDTHCFFANNILVHNCHHASARTCEDIIVASPKAYWRFGGTATLEREDGEELVIQGLFGRKIVDISLSYLIKHGWLVPAGVFFVPVVMSHMPYTSYHQVYSHCVINNEEVTQNVSELSQYLATLGKSSLILVSKISQGKKIKSIIPGSVFLTGKDTSRKRKKAIEDMRSGKLKILIATTLADEGLDIRCLDVVHMVAAGASITRVPQRIGRVVRLSQETNKKYGLAIYYHYCTEYLYDHGLKAKKIVSLEPALDYIQANDYKDLKIKILRYMQQKEPLDFMK